MTRHGISDRERRALFDRLAFNGAALNKVTYERRSDKTKRLAASRSQQRWQTDLWRVALIASFLFLSNRLCFALLGALNRIGLSLGTVFLAYPGSDDILRKYCYARIREWACWRPTLIGAYRQEGCWGLMFAITGTEIDFERSENAFRLTQLFRRMESIRRTIGAHEVRFAGVLPSKFRKHGVTARELEVDAATTALLKAEKMVRDCEGIDETAPIIVLGANGFVGQRLTAKLVGRTVYPIDVGPLGASEPNRNGWPTHLNGQRAVLINVAASGTLALYLGLVWKSLVILNEAYPAPSPALLQELVSRNCRCYHLAGVVGTCYPKFPQPYARAVPCCAARVARDTPIVMERLT
ncbi:MAG: hypothetical protein C5B58_07775 [Acidobacteria bacterium]|nr:MAG: hypothetical protein C5B58_07775 [Acidobacteriota bacterium]